MVVIVVMVDSRYGAGWDRDFPETGDPDKGPRKLGDGVLIVVHSGWLAASRPPVVSGLK